VRRECTDDSVARDALTQFTAHSQLFGLQRLRSKCRAKVLRGCNAVVGLHTQVQRESCEMVVVQLLSRCVKKTQPLGAEGLSLRFEV
jgi:hypothetical protein